MTPNINNNVSASEEFVRTVNEDVVNQRSRSSITRVGLSTVGIR